jgi:DNA-binding transcriptional MerR regulator
MARNAAISTADPVAAEDAARLDHFRAPEMGEADAHNDATNDRPLTIAEVAREFGMTLRALRFYEAKRLVTPQRRGPSRLYRRGDRERLSLILTGRRLGFTLAEIGGFLGKPDGKGLNLTREQCVAQINLLERQKRNTEIAIAELRQIYTSFYKKFLDDADSRFRRAG